LSSEGCEAYRLRRRLVRGGLPYSAGREGPEATGRR